MQQSKHNNSNNNYNKHTHFTFSGAEVENEKKVKPVGLDIVSQDGNDMNEEESVFLHGRALKGAVRQRAHRGRVNSEKEVEKWRQEAAEATFWPSKLSGLKQEAIAN